MSFPTEETKSGWLTKLGGNALRKTWKRRWFVLKGSCLYYFRTPNDKEPAGIVPLVSYNTVTHDSTATKKSEFCIRVEKVYRSSDSVHSLASLREMKTPPTFIAYADTEAEMHSWLTILQRRVGERNIVDIVLDRLDLTAGLGHRRQASFGSLKSFYSRNGSMNGSTNGSTSTLSSRRPSLDSLSLGTPSLDSRKSSIDSVRGPSLDGNGSSTNVAGAVQQNSRPESPINSLIATYGLSAPILRKPASSSCLHDRRPAKPIAQTRKLSPRDLSAGKQQPSAPVIMVHGDNPSKLTSSPDAVFFPDRPGAGDTTPVSNLFPRHLADAN